MRGVKQGGGLRYQIARTSRRLGFLGLALLLSTTLLLTPATAQALVETLEAPDEITTQTTLTDTSNTAVNEAQTDSTVKQSSKPVTDEPVVAVTPNTPAITNPEDGALVKSPFGQIWTPISGSDHYLYESCDAEPAGPQAVCPGTVQQESLVNNQRTVSDDSLNSHFWWRVSAVDNEENQSIPANWHELTVDNTAPEVEWDESNPLYTLDRTPAVDGHATDSSSGIDSVQFMVSDQFDETVLDWTNATPSDGAFDGEATENFQATPTANLDDGTYTFTGRAFDRAGNMTEEFSFTIVVVDTTSPIVAVLSPQEGEHVSGVITPVGIIVDESLKEYYFVIVDSLGNVVATVDGDDGTVEDTDPFVVTIFDFDTTSVADGEYQVRLQAKDQLGNEEPNPVDEDPEVEDDAVDWINFVIDNTAPDVSITSHNDNDIVNNQEDITVSGEATDEGSGIERVRLFVRDLATNTNVFIDLDAEVTDGLWHITIPAGTLHDGDYRFRAVALDSGGNTASAVTQPITVMSDELAAPTNGRPNDVALNVNRVRATWDSVDKAEQYEFELVLGNNSKTASGHYKNRLGHEIGSDTMSRKYGSNYRPVAEGTYYWQVRAIDAFGAVGPWSEEFSFVIDRTPGRGGVDGAQGTSDTRLVSTNTNLGTNGQVLSTETNGNERDKTNDEKTADDEDKKKDVQDSNSNWWWLLLILLAIVLWYVLWRRSGNEEEQS